MKQLLLFSLILITSVTFAQQSFSSGKVITKGGYTISYDLQTEKPIFKTEYCAEIPWKVSNLVIHAVSHPRFNRTFTGNDLAFDYLDYTNGVTFPIPIPNAEADNVRPLLELSFDGKSYQLAAGTDAGVIKTCPNDIDAAAFVENTPTFTLGTPGFLPHSLSSPYKHKLGQVISSLMAYKLQMEQDNKANNTNNPNEHGPSPSSTSPESPSSTSTSNQSSSTQSSSNDTDDNDSATYVNVENKSGLKSATEIRADYASYLDTQNIASSQMSAGNFREAATTYANAGMTTEAIASLGADVVVNVVNILKEARQDKIKNYRQTVASQLDEVEKQYSTLENTYSDSSFDAYLAEEHTTRALENKLIENSDWLCGKVNGYCKMSSDLQTIQKNRIRNIFKINTKQIVEAMLDSDEQIKIYDNSFSKNDVTRAFNKAYTRENEILSGITDYNTKTTLANELGAIDEERIKLLFEYNESTQILSEEAFVHLYLRSTYYNDDYNKKTMDYFNKQDLAKRTRLFFASVLQPFTGDTQQTKNNDSKLLLLLHRGYNLNFFSTLYDGDKAYSIADWVSEYMPNSQSNYLIQNKIKELRKSEDKKEDVLFLERKECLTPMCEVPPKYFKADEMLELDKKANEAITDFINSSWLNNMSNNKVKGLSYEDMLQRGRLARNLKDKKDIQSLYQEFIYENHNKVTFGITTFKVTRLFQAFPFRYFSKTESTDLESRNYIERFDGEIGYTTFNGQVTEYDTKKRKTYKDREHFIREFIEEDNVSVDSRKLKATFQCEVDGVSYYGFEFKVRGNDETDKEIEYFNMETGLSKRTEYFNDEVMIYAITDTYDAFDGVLFPTKIETENNFILQTAKAIKTEVNKEFDAAIFE